MKEEKGNWVIYIIHGTGEDTARENAKSLTLIGGDGTEQ
jgi:hypothetical protein